MRKHRINRLRYGDHFRTVSVRPPLNMAAPGYSYLLYMPFQCPKHIANGKECIVRNHGKVKGYHVPNTATCEKIYAELFAVPGIDSWGHMYWITRDYMAEMAWKEQTDQDVEIYTKHQMKPLWEEINVGFLTKKASFFSGYNDSSINVKEFYHLTEGSKSRFKPEIRKDSGKWT